MNIPTNAQTFDNRLQASAARLFAGLSPISIALAYMDWTMNLAAQPAQTSHLALKAHAQALKPLAAMSNLPIKQDVDARFADPDWQKWPWSGMVMQHQGMESWWQEATALRGMNPHHQDVLQFFARQCLDMLSPANIGLGNPEVLRRTQERMGGNLLDGALNAMKDTARQVYPDQNHSSTHKFIAGLDLAITPGKVVYRNRLVELIQYLPMTSSVHAEPIFIVPSWIMKYYILDLSAYNSMVKWLVMQGHTVFILSWRNPDESDAQLGLGDYLKLGIFDALAAIKSIVPDQPVHACGYCLGGTLLSIAAAALAKPGKVGGADQFAPLASVSLLATETDFKEPGEMGVLIDDAQVTVLESMMAERGFLTGKQMAGSFTFLHSRDLIWSKRLREFWLGEPDQPNDLMAWNADVTRMPAAMHSEYLRRCYLRNELAEGRFPVEGQAVSLFDIHLPLFVVGTEKDHVAPWKSVYKIHHLTKADVTFVLTSGGHNAGIVSEPGHPHRHYAIQTQVADAPVLTPEQWQSAAPRFEGSWWQSWSDWMIAQGTGTMVKARTPDANTVLCDAPGAYIHIRYYD
eukprot:gene17624-17827_t